MAGTIAAGERGVPGRAYNIGGGSRVSMNEVLRIIERLAGHPLKIAREAPQKGDMRDTYADTTLARRELAFEPSVRSNRGLKRSIDGCRRHPRSDEPSPRSDAVRERDRAARRRAPARPRSQETADGTPEPDKFLFERGTEELDKRHWVVSREYFRQLVDSYPQSIYRADAKLGVGDTYLGEGSAESDVLAINEFREFLSFYPTHKRADYAQLKLGMAHFYQMRAPERDQTETREAIRELQTFVTRYPTRN